MAEKICVVGLGYVGLPLALAFAEAGFETVGFDRNAVRAEALGRGRDLTGEASSEALAATNALFTADTSKIAAATVYILAVPTPIDRAKVPDLSMILDACAIVGPALHKGDLVILESTVYPGVTEDVCAPALAAASGMKAFEDFKLGYSPERINPGDKEHTVRSIVKVVSGQDEETLARVAALYEPVITAGLHRAPSIKVAEASKVIENIQRDINIALMNDLAMLFHELDIDTEAVLRASGSKWNFLPFKPGLVGGHCIGVDPYYLIHRAAGAGYHEQMIGAGRRVNDTIPDFIATEALTLLARRQGVAAAAASRVAVVGVTFKEDVPDIRNSKSAELVAKLRDFGLDVSVHDARADSDEVRNALGITLSPIDEVANADCVVLTVPHSDYMLDNGAPIRDRLKRGAILLDVKAALYDHRDALRAGHDIVYWSL